MSRKEVKLISINDLTVSFGGYTLLDGINFHINDKDRIGLVGKNGAGKSTVLKLIMGIQNPVSGKILIPSSLKLGYLPQMMEHSGDKTVMEETMTAFKELNELNGEMDRISQQLAERTDYDSDAYSNLMVRLNELSDAISIEGNEPPRQRAEKTLLGLGFRKNEFDRLTSTFSQGWNMRIELAKILLRNPDVLLLDEPTNHLDIESIQWLEDYLKEFRGALLLISHDRRFLDNCTTRTVEIMLGHIYDYKVPYSKYVELRKERIAQQRAAYANQQRMIEKTEEFIEKFRYKPTKSNQVQSRIKQLDRIERIEIDEEDLATLCVKFPPAPRSGDVAFLVKDAFIGYENPHKEVLKDVSLTIRRGEKVAFVGRNGEGKTTMMKVLMNELFPTDGQARLGYNVNVGYYAQNQNDVLVKSDTVYDTLDKVATGDVRTRLRDILAAFLFRGEDIDKKVAVLSGGERARLAMARLMLNPYNLLALDEPTNHMDIRSKDVLKQALVKYDGTLIVVSHDRDFLDGLVNKVYEFADGRVKEHLGGVDDFLRSKKTESFREIEMSHPERKPQQTSQQTFRQNPQQKVSGQKMPQESSGSVSARSESSSKSSGKNIDKNIDKSFDKNSDKNSERSSYEQQKAISRDARKVKNRISLLEKQIAELEAKMAQVEKVLSSPQPDTDIMEMTRNYLEYKRELDAKMEQWMLLQ